LRGADRAEAAAALARIYIDADRPRAAVQTLRATRFARLPAALNDRRRWLEARALIESKDDETAIVLLERDESAEAASLRGDIYWRAENWSAAGGTPALALACARCGTAHGPGAPDCRCIPTLVVDDKYRVGMDVGRKVALDVVDHIIAMERGEGG